MVRVAAAAVRVAPFFCNSAINSAASCTFGGATRTPAGCDSHSCGVRRPPLGASRGVGLPDSRLSAPRLEVGFGSTRLPGTPDSRAALRRLGRARDSAGSPRAGELWRGGCDSRPPSLLDRPSLRGPPLPRPQQLALTHRTTSKAEENATQVKTVKDACNRHAPVTRAVSVSVPHPDTETTLSPHSWSQGPTWLSASG